ncbi:unnamed protein product [Oppiella nova]|uniref:Nudix hydrolase domain-containing protein n=1 Tax=Oppiella nova TaxID=334625 RepID=A0A7R9LKH3_9ACAR|nr:unnamed protein product [Oppiella nova]CAG2163872.1 unnamed protein product [Oppiella nova]
MDSLDTQIETILNGQPLSQDIPVICDYNPWDLFSRSVTAVIFNEDMDVLMVQESKSGSRGKWSLPAGKVDPNEQIIDAIRREVLEESGLEIEATDLVVIDTFGYNFRFTFSGHVIGGQLKTVANKHSIEAKWCSQTAIKSLNLRYEDTMDLVNVVRNHNISLAMDPWRRPHFTAIGAHNRMLLRVVFTVRRKQNNRQYVLISRLPFPHLPVCAMHEKHNLKSILTDFLKEKLIKKYPVDSLLGVLSVEHNGVPRSPQDSPHDGLCITVLAKSRVPYEGMGRICGDYEWMQMSPSLEALLTRCLDNPNTELIQWRPKFWCKRPSKRRTNRSSHSKNMDKLSAQIAAL